MHTRSLTAAATSILGLAASLVVGLPAPANAATHCHGTTIMSIPDRSEVPTTSPGSGNRGCILAVGDGKVGDQYHAVMVLQISLNACYNQNIPLDGDYGALTKAAVRNVQNFHNVYGGAGLAVDGVFGPRTASVMEFRNTAGRCWA